MKKTMIISLLAIMVMAGACGKGGGSEEVAPAEIPTKGTEVVKQDTVVKETPNQDNLPQEDTIRLADYNYETPCKGDSSAVPFKVVQIPLQRRHENGNTPHWVINTNLDYQQSARNNAKLPYIDFGKYTLLVTSLFTPYPYFIAKQSVFNICKNGSISFNTEFDQGVSTAPSAISYYIVIPKIQDSTQVHFNIKVRN